MKKKNEQLRSRHSSNNGVIEIEQVLFVNALNEKWQMFVKVVHAHVDPILASMLYETDIISFDADKKVVHIASLKKFLIFQDLFIEQKSLYQEYLDRVFGFNTILFVEFIKTSNVSKKIDGVHDAAPRVAVSEVVHDSNQANSRTKEKIVGKYGKMVDVTDMKKWKLTHMLLERFGGTVQEISKDTHEFDA